MENNLMKYLDWGNCNKLLRLFYIKEAKRQLDKSIFLHNKNKWCLWHVQYIYLDNFRRIKRISFVFGKDKFLFQWAYLMPSIHYKWKTTTRTYGEMTQTLEEVVGCLLYNECIRLIDEK